MALTNIIDHRKHPYRFEKINAVMEPTAHDNGLNDSDKVASEYDHIGYAEREHISLAVAVAWADGFPFATTLFLYDHDGGIYPTNDSSKTSHGT